MQMSEKKDPVQRERKEEPKKEGTFLVISVDKGVISTNELTPLIVMQYSLRYLQSYIMEHIKEGATDEASESILLNKSGLSDWKKLCKTEEGLKLLNTHLIARGEATKDKDPYATIGIPPLCAVRGHEGNRGLCCEKGKFYSMLTGLPASKGEPNKNCIPICERCTKLS
jgi:hypothetical protein